MEMKMLHRTRKLIASRIYNVSQWEYNGITSLHENQPRRKCQSIKQNMFRFSERDENSFIKYFINVL